jgi:RNA polymerase sigma-70 factor (ECF subfamily)
MSDNRFSEFVRRVRAGDQDAAAELVRQYESVIRLEVRVRMYDPGLRRAFDSMDVCQSVLRTFFVRAAGGQFDLDRPADLVGVLVGIAKNKVAEEVRRQHRQRRDNRRLAEGDEPLQGVADDEPTPAEVVEGKELMQRVRERLTEDERQVFDLRVEGLNWPEVAGRLGGTAEARRKQHTRAMDRVVGELGLDEPGEP